MRTFVASDDKEIAEKVRDTLTRNGHQCVGSNMVTLALAAERCVRTRPNLVVLAMPPSPQRALSVLRELKNTTGAHMLVVGHADDPKLILRTLREGADAYLDLAELDEELTEALVKLRHDAVPWGEPGRVIAVLAPNGGSGSSTLAANVATVLARQHNSAALIDLKLVTGDLAALLDVKPTHTLTDLCRHLARVDRELFLKLLARHPSGVHLLAAPANLREVTHVTTAGVRQAVTMARALFPYVLIDLDHSFHEEQVEVITIADVVLLVFRLDFASLQNTHKALQHLHDLGVDSSRIVPVVNRYGQPKELPSRRVEEALGMTVAHWIPDDPKSVNRANNKGVPVVLERPRAKVSRSLTTVAMSLNGVANSDVTVAS